MYHFLYNCVFCLAFINFLNIWIHLLFPLNPKKNFNRSQLLLNRTNNIPFNLALFGGLKNDNNLTVPITVQENSSFANENNKTKAITWTGMGGTWRSLYHYKSFSFMIGSILWLVVTLLLFSRLIESNHFPLANFYEALIFLAWCLVTVNFIILLQPSRSLKGNEVQKQVSSAILAPCILFIIAFGQIHLSSSISPLVPALKSNWLLMHVSIMICSYTTLLVGGLLSIILLIQTIFYQISRKSNHNYSNFSVSGNAFKIGQIGFPSFEYIAEGPFKMQKKNFFIVLDSLSYRMMGIGFPLLTLGILSGAVWANEAWGSYWSWDIKEVGSLINWLIVALYFHCRYKNFISLSHLISFISVMVLFFNFFGISLGIFGNSLHAYGAAS